MKNLNLSRRALTVCAAGMLFVGCGGSPAQSWNAAPPLGSGAKLIGGSLKQGAGGSFTASYTGTFELRCLDIRRPKEACSYIFHGTGSGTFIHRSTLKGKVFCGSSIQTGDFVFKSKRNPADRFYASAAPCGDSEVSYNVTGGTGKFANASGGGNVSVSLDVSNLTFTSSWTGVLYY